MQSGSAQALPWLPHNVRAQANDRRRDLAGGGEQPFAMCGRLCQSAPVQRVSQDDRKAVVGSPGYDSHQALDCGGIEALRVTGHGV
ncbi:MAG TPA: hypothetical protein VNL16_17135, partial [Chloroflexota bacterium]|nr:hypothetical protein [Chloroflexota bacterium]